jgi:hypothetical protein
VNEHLRDAASHPNPDVSAEIAEFAEETFDTKS